MNQKSIFFIAGVHGVGKGTFCKNLTEKFPIDHVSASDLIRKRKFIQQAKNIEGIGDNQLILEEELRNFKAKHKNIVLDGHFCLLDSAKNIINLPLGLFEKVNLKGIILLEAKSETVFLRLLNRDKGNSGLDLQDINNLILSESIHAERVAQELNIPFFKISTEIDLLDSDLVKIVQELGVE